MDIRGLERFFRSAMKTEPRQGGLLALAGVGEAGNVLPHELSMAARTLVERGGVEVQESSILRNRLEWV